MKRHKSDIREVIYIQLHSNSEYVLSYGIEFLEFIQSIPSRLEYLLLLKHQFDDGDFNLHTRLEYVPAERMMKLMEDDVYSYGEFCWIDFEEMESLNELTKQELAELLYIGHMKQPLQQPFYNKLANNFVYLANADGWFNKTYYREIDDFFTMLGEVITEKMSELKIEKTLFGLGRKRSYPIIGKEVLYFLKESMHEGVAISIEKVVQSRNKIEIPVWCVGDFVHMDHMYETYEVKSKKQPDAKLVFDRKVRSWCVYRK